MGNQDETRRDTGRQEDDLSEVLEAFREAGMQVFMIDEDTDFSQLPPLHVMLGDKPKKSDIVNVFIRDLLAQQSKMNMTIEMHPGEDLVVEGLFEGVPIDMPDVISAFDEILEALMTRYSELRYNGE